ncbi:MAG TPA: sulfatase-like hydrolase/transferase, partial [Thermoleophilaceae bacterium]|nr:sulfatase-like hydrolase/transferase [Thermoleophilaceae bacterium]
LVALGLALDGSSRSRRAVAQAGEGTVPHAVGPPRTIVMVVFDELPLTSLMEPGGRIDGSRYPAFARLARDGIWYRGATAVHDSTALATPAMLDGRYPRPGLESNAYSHPANLFTLLAREYELHVSEEATGMCPTSLCVPTPGTTASHLSRGKPGRFHRFVRGIRPTARPALWFKHVLLPHVPWQYYPSGRSYRRFAPEPIPGLNGPLGFGVPWLVKVSYQRHLLQLGLADRLLGELVARLRSEGLYRDALVVAAADHGIGFRRGLERRTVRPRNIEDLAPVPLMVKLPGAHDGRVVDRHVETIDVLPTILELAEVPVPHEVDGRSLFEPAPAQASRVTIYHRVGIELNTIGGRYTFDPALVARRRDAAVARKTAWFGSGGGRNARALYRIGPHAELIGRRAASLPRAPAADGESVRTTIDQAAELAAVDPASNFVPGQITGTLEPGRAGGGRAIAVAVNGTIAATSRTFSLDGSRAEQFEAIVPESAFRRGANEVQLFEIVRGGDGPALRVLLPSRP